MAIVVICILTLLTLYGIFVGNRCEKESCTYDMEALELPKEYPSEFYAIAAEHASDCAGKRVASWRSTPASEQVGGPGLHLAIKAAKAKSGTRRVKVQDCVKPKSRPKVRKTTEEDKKAAIKDAEISNSDDDWGKEWTGSRCTNSDEDWGKGWTGSSCNRWWETTSSRLPLPPPPPPPPPWMVGKRKRGQDSGEREYRNRSWIRK
jgi:hypothetical protein